MNHYFLLFLCFCCLNCLISCSSVEQPSFIKMEQVNVEDINLSSATITADALFNNSNAFGLTVTGTDLDLILEGVKVGNVLQTEEKKIPANSNFSIPVKTKIDLSLIQSNLLDSALKMLGDSKLELRFKGSLKVKALKMEIGVPVDFTQELKTSDILGNIRLPF